MEWEGGRGLEIGLLRSVGISLPNAEGEEAVDATAPDGE